MNKLSPTGAALITGGAKRIGQAISLKLAAMGYDIALHYHSSAGSAHKLQKTIERMGVRCQCFKSNLQKRQATERIIKQVRGTFKNFNVLVNNASTFNRSNLKSPINSFDKDFDVNFKAPLILTKQFAQICKKGQIINILDTHITKNTSAHFHYLLCKKLLGELTKMAAAELSPEIRVNAIAPGLILPPQGQGAGYLQRLSKHIPLKTQGSVNQIAHSIEFLVNNTYLTGQILFNDGGEHLA